MKTFYLNQLESVVEDCVVALGFFDGMHLGHQQLLEQSEIIAKEKNIKKALMTFDVAPKSVLLQLPENYLMTLKDKEDYLEQRGFDYLFVLPFSKEIASLSADKFLQNYLINGFMKHFVCGYDFHFGHLGAGNPELLKEVCPTKIVAKYELSHHRVSTSSIKEDVTLGLINKANTSLGSSYSIQGEVIYGKQRGKSQLGFATANIDYKGYVLPKNGVYATLVQYNDKIYKGMTNIGYNPTFGDIERPSMEVHLFEFDEMIYGKTIKVFFKKRIRPEMKFESLEQLKTQLNNDQKECFEYLK